MWFVNQGRSRRSALESREPGLKVLLDTCFLLPSLEVYVGREVAKGLEGLAETEIYYYRFNVLEALWVVIWLLRAGAFDGDRFSLGLRFLTLDKELVEFIGDMGLKDNLMFP